MILSWSELAETFLLAPPQPEWAQTEPQYPMHEMPLFAYKEPKVHAFLSLGKSVANRDKINI